MKIKIILFISVFFVNINLFSQNYLPYYGTINKAEIATLDRQFQKSDSLYQVAFSIVEKPFKEDFFLAAWNADNLNDDVKVYNYLKKGIKNGLIFKRVKELKNFKRSKYYKILKQDYKGLISTHMDKLNVPLRNEIADMIKEDQKARKSLFLGVKKWRKVDAYNFKRLLEIIKENDGKWPGFSIIGEITPKGKYDVTDNIVLMLLHFKSEQIDALKPYMLKAVLNGEMYPYHYARIIDYKSSNAIPIKAPKRKTILKSISIYGTYANSLIANRTIAEIERAKIGFEPLDDYYRKINSTYTCIEN